MFCVHNGNKRTRKYVDTSYANLRNTLENIIRNNLSLTNTVMVENVTVRKNGKSVYLLNRKYSFNLEEYFQRVLGNGQNRNKRVAYRKHGMQ